jgi:hypothetical protein
MDEFLIVDGYNVINDWPNLVDLKESNMEHARDKLIQIMQNYGAYKNIKIIIVYDAYLSESKMRSSYYNDYVEVIYSKKGETADMVIEKLIDFMPPRSKIEVATSDWAVQRIIMGKGALRISARELYVKIMEAEKGIKVKIENNKKNSGNVLGSYLGENIKKKLEKWRRDS